MFWSVVRKKLALNKSQLLLLYAFLTVFATLLTCMVLAFPVSNYYYNQAFSSKSFTTEISGPFSDDSMSKLEQLVGPNNISEFALYREVEFINGSKSTQTLVVASTDAHYIGRSWVQTRDVLAGSNQESNWIDLDSVSAHRLSAGPGDQIQIDLGTTTKNVVVRNVISFRHFATDALAIVDASILGDQYQTNLIVVGNTATTSARISMELGPSFSVVDRVEAQDSVSRNLPYADRVILIISIMAFIASVALFMREAAVLKDQTMEQKRIMEFIGASRSTITRAYTSTYIFVTFLAVATAYVATVYVVYPSTSFGSVPPSLLRYVVGFFGVIFTINILVIAISQTRRDGAGALESKGVRF